MSLASDGSIIIDLNPVDSVPVAPDYFLGFLIVMAVVIIVTAITTYLWKLK